MYNNNGTMTPLKVLAVKSRIPIQPIPEECPSDYTKLWVTSNVFSLTDFPLPHTDWWNNLYLSNELVNVWGSNYYYKVYNANDVKVWGIIYKITDPNFDYYWAFTTCIEDA